MTHTGLGITAAATLTFALAAGALTRPLVLAQSATDSTPTFEVASVKRNTSGQPFIRIGGGGIGRFEATNVPLRLLIRNAYQLQDFQIVGAPAWINEQRFDIIAKAP